MNDLNCRLIQSVCDNNVFKAKKIAKIILEKDKTQKNRYFRESMLLQLNATTNLIELPTNIKGLLIMEDVETSFNENRYYLSDREKAIADIIFKMNGAARKLAEIGVNYVNSTLLYGESGTGKTTFGRYIAYKMGLPFAYINFSNVIDSYLGGTQKNISKIFDYIKQQKCVFMIDEMDAIGMERGSHKETGELSRIVIGLMQSLDTLTSDVVLLGATNRIGIIDKALLRRFTTKHEIKRLTRSEQEAMIIKFFDDVDYDVAPEEFERLVSELLAAEDTQAGLVNRMIMVLVNHYMEELEVN